MERLYSDDYNKIYLAILKQIPFSECGYEGAEAQSVYDDILKELQEAPVGIMPMLVNDWGGDEWDGVVAQLLSQMDEREKEADGERKGNYEITKSVEDGGESNQLDPAAKQINPRTNDSVENRYRGKSVNSPDNYELILSGSSIFGIIRDKKIWEKSYSFLNAKSVQGKLKCFIWWCKACKRSPLVLGGDPCNHVIKISIPNVLKLIDGFDVQWEWKDPQSEWAISAGTANESFRDLVARKSRPNWVIEISKP